MNDLIQQFGLEFVLTDIALKVAYGIDVQPEQETEKQMVESGS